VWDRALGRATYLDTTGQVARSRAVEAIRLNESFIGSLDAGDFFLQWVRRSTTNQRIVVRVSDQRVDTIISAPLPVKQVMAFGELGWELEVFAPNPASTTSADALWWAHGGPFEVLRLSREGSAQAVLRYQITRRPVTPQFFSWYADSSTFQGPWPEDEKPEIRRVLDRRGYADSLPSIDRVAVGRDGRVWMRRYQYPGEMNPWEWLVVEPDGMPVAWVEIPRNLVLHEYSSEDVLGISRDVLGVQYVTRFRILRPH
jgi:hypothetical protein